jgi:hypothetical protein
MTKLILTLITWLLASRSLTRGFGDVDEVIAFHESLAAPVSSDSIDASIVSYDIITALQQSDDPRQTIYSHITDLQRTQRTVSASISVLQSQASSHQSTRQSCASAKIQTDRQFFFGLETYRSREYLDTIAMVSADYAACVERARVMIRSYELMTQRAQTLSRQLTDRIALLTTHAEVLIQYHDLIGSDTSIITQVNRLNERLR